jgi:hypothetical protein
LSRLVALDLVYWQVDTIHCDFKQLAGGDEPAHFVGVAADERHGLRRVLLLLLDAMVAVMAVDEGVEEGSVGIGAHEAFVDVRRYVGVLVDAVAAELNFEHSLLGVIANGNKVGGFYGNALHSRPSYFSNFKRATSQSRGSIDRNQPARGPLCLPIRARYSVLNISLGAMPI